MCFSIPKKVVRVEKGIAFVEGGQQIYLGSDIRVKSGQYLRTIGNIAVGTLEPREGLKVRQLIKSLNTQYV